MVWCSVMRWGKVNYDEIRWGKVVRCEVRRWGEARWGEKKRNETEEAKRDKSLQKKAGRVDAYVFDRFGVALARTKNIISRLSQQKNTRRTWLVTDDYSASRPLMEHLVQKHLSTKYSATAGSRVAQHDAQHTIRRNTRHVYATMWRHWTWFFLQNTRRTEEKYATNKWQPSWYKPCTNPLNFTNGGFTLRRCLI